MKTSAFSRLLTVGTVLIFFLSVASFDLQASELGKTLPFGTPHFSYNQLSQIPPIKLIKSTRVAGYQVKAALASLQYVTNEDPIVSGPGGGGAGSVATTTPASYDLAIISGEATSLGFKFNFCNNGDAVTSFPVSIYVGSTLRTFNLAGLYAAHTCQMHTWDYGVWGVSNAGGSTYSVEVDVDINHTIAETNETNNTTQMVLTIPSSAFSPDLNIAELTVTMLDSSIPTSRRVYWRSTIAAGVGEYRYASSSSALSLLPWRSDGVVDGTQTGNIFGSQLDLANLTPGATYYIEVRKWYNGISGRVYGNSSSTSFTIANPTICSDTDGGFVPNNKGTVCVGSNCVSDTCSTAMGGQFIHEYFCQGATRSSAEESCGYGNICYQGACVKGDQMALPYQSRTTTCSDSDGGSNLNVKGVTRGENYQGVYMEAYDKCTSATSDYGADTGDYVAEFYCMPNSGQSFATSKASSWVYPSYRNKCQYGCKDGRCLTANEVTPPSTVCAGSGLRADIYGGPNQVCCAGLVLQGGICNQPTSTQPDFIISDIKIEQRVGDTAKYVYVTVKNIGATAVPANVIFNARIEDLDSGWVDAAADTTDFVAGYTKDLSSAHPLQLNNSGTYRIKVTADSLGFFTESNETNNSLTKTIVIGEPNVCAGPGLRADIYGGPNQVCCVGLVLQGGVCNNSASSQNKTVAVVSPNGGETYAQGSSIAVSWSGARNWVIVGLVEGSATSATIPSTNTSLPLLGWIKQSNDASGSVIWDGKQVCDLLLTTCWPVQPGQYKIVASSKNLMGNATLWNADSNFDLSDAPFTLTSKGETSTKLTVCHLNSAGNYTILDISQDGWDNGHKQHSGDFIKTGEGTCEALAANNGLVPNSGNQNDGPVQVPGLVTTPQTPTQTTQDKKDEFIQHLQARIEKLEYRLSDLENSVITREQVRETKVNQNLTNRLVGRMLLQVEQKGEVWFIGYDGKKYYLANGKTAYEILKAFGTGITEADFAKLSETESTPFGKAHVGMIFIRVEKNGEAYYITNDGIAVYVKDGPAAYSVMKKYSIGATDATISQLETGNLDTNSQ